jgi:Tol biopolymer transport system component
MRLVTLLALALALPVLPSLAQDAAGGKILYSRKDGQRWALRVMNADGTGDRELPGPTSAVNLFPTWSPDGKRVAFMGGPSAQFREFQLYLMNADGSGLKVVNAASRIAGLPAWSPDGKRLAYVAGDEEPNVFLADAEGEGARRINPEGSGAVFPFWKGTDILGYTKITPDVRKSELVLQKLDGAPETVMAMDHITFSGANGLSPDGKRLVFAAVNPETRMGSLRVWEFDTKGETTLSEFEAPQGEEAAGFPTGCWSPDGKSMLISRKTDKGTGLFLISEDGKTEKRLTPEGADCYFPAWSK